MHQIWKWSCCHPQWPMSATSDRWARSRSCETSFSGQSCSWVHTDYLQKGLHLQVWMSCDRQRLLNLQVKLHYGHVYPDFGIQWSSVSFHVWCARHRLTGLQKVEAGSKLVLLGRYPRTWVSERFLLDGTMPTWCCHCGRGATAWPFEERLPCRQELHCCDGVCWQSSSCLADLSHCSRP